MPRRSKTPKRSQSDEDDDAASFDWSQVNSETFEFKITFDPKPSKKRKRGEPSFTQPQYQDNPLEGCGLPPVTYAVSPTVWDSITRYRKFTIANETFEVHDCVLVNLDPDEEARPRKLKPGRTTSLPVDAIENRWIAHVLEVRAADEQHVFLRVNWVYRPEDLPSGRQPHHGAAELVPSNFMQIIDAMAVDGSVRVRRWHEEDEDEDPAQDGLYFRQWFDQTKNKLSPVRQHCVCRKPANPDKLLIKCSNPACKTWLHAECLEREAVKAAYTEAGLPHPDAAATGAGKANGHPQKGRVKPAKAALTNGHQAPELEPDLDFEASLVQPDGAAEYVLEVTDKRGPGQQAATNGDSDPAPAAPKKQIVKIRCLKCDQLVE